MPQGGGQQEAEALSQSEDEQVQPPVKEFQLQPEREQAQCGPPWPGHASQGGREVQESTRGLCHRPRDRRIRGDRDQEQVSLLTQTQRRPADQTQWDHVQEQQHQERAAGEQRDRVCPHQAQPGCLKLSIRGLPARCFQETVNQDRTSRDFNPVQSVKR